ncbi:MAG: segregation/condensation protein A [Firmicutes bacterium]|nr:segregation/condensation protein A [Bacillota bacterium]
MEYALNIDSFQGPLDLLLHLIKEAKMDIFDLKIEEITNQYLAYINKMEEMNLDIASSYLVMSAELLEIKSKMLLPKHNNDDEIEEEDPREELVNKLIEYQRYKDLTSSFKDLEVERHMIYTKLPENIKEYVDENQVVNGGEVTLDDLVDAFKKFLERQKLNQPLNTKVTSKEITVEHRRRSIKKILLSKKKVNFMELFDIINKEYVVVTFLAVLEMAKAKELIIRQENNFDEIVCEVAHE